MRIEHLASPVGDEVSISEVHFVADGKNIHVGDPTIAGASVKGTVVDEGRGRKVIAFKKKRRKGYRRKIGHRQGYTALRIDKIVVSEKWHTKSGKVVAVTAVIAMPSDLALSATVASWLPVGRSSSDSVELVLSRGKTSAAVATTACSQPPMESLLSRIKADEASSFRFCPNSAILLLTICLLLA